MPITRPYLVLTAAALLLSVLFLVLEEPAAGSTSIWTSVFLDIQTVQRDLHRELAAAMRAVQEHGVEAGYALVGLSFLYGVFHAAGPGHGKVVISTYLLTQESQMRRGLVLSLLASLCQGLTAIVAVTATVEVLGLTLRQSQGTATHLETLSYALVALLGLMLVASRVRQLVRWRRGNGAHAHHHHHDHPHDHHTHDGAANHAHGPACNHAHAPTLRELETPLSWHGLAGMVASIGVRPCSGAILVLLVAYSVDLRIAGMTAVMAMSLGTAITVSLLAVLSVYARKGALWIASRLPDSATRLALAVDVIAVLGGGVIFIAGALMLQGALSAPVHPLR